MPWKDYLYDDWWGDDDWGGGGHGHRQRRSTEVEFYRPDGDTEGKDIGWCLDNGFHEIEDGLWSGDWYYDHHPNFLEEKTRKEEEAANKRSKISADEVMERVNKRRRGELLDEIYNGAYHPHHPMYDAARRELDILDGNVQVVAKKRTTAKTSMPSKPQNDGFCCPVQGCSQRFPTKEKQEEHVQEQTGKGHNRYRLEHCLPFLGWKATGRTADTNTLSQGTTESRSSTQGAAAPMPTLPSNQTDILSTSMPMPPSSNNKQTDIRSFFPTSNKT